MPKVIEEFFEQDFSFDPDWCAKCAQDDAKLRGVENGCGYSLSPYHWNAH